MILAEKWFEWLRIGLFFVILRLKIADPMRENSNEKWKRLKWAIWGPTKNKNGWKIHHAGTCDGRKRQLGSWHHKRLVAPSRCRRYNQTLVSLLTVYHLTEPLVNRPLYLQAFTDYSSFVTSFCPYKVVVVCENKFLAFHFKTPRYPKRKVLARHIHIDG